MGTGHPGKAVSRGLLVAAAALFVLLALRYRGYLVDDAFISLRYARHLVEGEGLVFNPGERVEGYTNFLWVLAAALLMELGLDPVKGLQVLSLAAALVLLGGVAWTARGAMPGVRPPPLVWLLPLPAFAYWSTTAMESMAFAALWTVAMALGLGEARSGRWRGSVAVFLLLALTRPEGVLCFGLSLGALAVAERLRRGAWPLRRRALDAGAFALVYGAYTGWRVAYYGDWLPNTFHAKATGGTEQLVNGWLALRDWGAAHPLLALTLLAPALLALPRVRRSAAAIPEAVTLWILAACWTGYVVAIGGDFMPFHRFFLPALPIYALLASWALATVMGAWAGTRITRLAVPALVILWLVHVAASLPGDEPTRAFVAHRTAVVGEEVGRFLAKRLEPDDLVAVNTAGSVPWASRLPSLDTLGLVDREIARHPIFVVSPRWGSHRRGWGDYVLGRRPRVVLWYNSAGAREPHYLGDHQLAGNPFFRFFYQLRREQLPARSVGDPDRAVARIAGAPFGDGSESGPISPNLGARFEVKTIGPEWLGLRRTAAFEAPIVLHYFERRDDAAQLWPLFERAEGDLDRFLETVVAAWRRHAAARPLPDRTAVRTAEKLAERARLRLEAGDPDGAKELLSRAAEANRTARSPLVYQYVANVAVLEGDLPLAVQAQREALKLAPENPLYRNNLLRLLRRPWSFRYGLRTGRSETDRPVRADP